MSHQPTRDSVALAIHRPGSPEHVLLVLRPPDDPDLPELWGLPASSRTPGEPETAAAVRTGRDKLGVAVRPGRLLAQGSAARDCYLLRMRLFTAEITDGEPHVPQPVRGITSYTAWRWATADLLVPAASRGSLCCNLFLRHASP